VDSLRNGRVSRPVSRERASRPGRQKHEANVVDLDVLARATILSDYLEDEGRVALAFAARNLARELGIAAANLRRSRLRPVA
jgi:hypothetical protein